MFISDFKIFFLNILLDCIEKIFKKLRYYNDFGAGEGFRTLDFNLIHSYY